MCLAGRGETGADRYYRLIFLPLSSPFMFPFLSVCPSSSIVDIILRPHRLTHCTRACARSFHESRICRDGPIGIDHRSAAQRIVSGDWRVVHSVQRRAPRRRPKHLLQLLSTPHPIVPDVPDWTAYTAIPPSLSPRCSHSGVCADSYAHAPHVAADTAQQRTLLRILSRTVPWGSALAAARFQSLCSSCSIVGDLGLPPYHPPSPPSPARAPASQLSPAAAAAPCLSLHPPMQMLLPAQARRR